MQHLGNTRRGCWQTSSSRFTHTPISSIMFQHYYNRLNIGARYWIKNHFSSQPVYLSTNPICYHSHPSLFLLQVFHTTFHQSLLMINIILSAQHFLNTIPTHISLRTFSSLCLNIQRLERYAILFKVGNTLTGCWHNEFEHPEIIGVSGYEKYTGHTNKKIYRLDGKDMHLLSQLSITCHYKDTCLCQTIL